MVRKCGGLPLAIAVLGGLLANKSLKEWELVQKDINSQFIKLQQSYQYAGVNWILALSYDDLPSRLKPCFLYLSQFSEDSEVQKKTLIRMWIAEGFISSPLGGGDDTMEDAAEKYLEDLASRCMVQVSQRDHTGTRIKKIRIHDLMRHMCLSKAREENFLKIAEHREDTTTKSSSNTLGITTKSRRIAIHPRIHQHDVNKKFRTPLVKGDAHLRSLFYFAERSRYGMTRQQAVFLFKNFRLLRVLNLQGVYLYDGYSSKEICNLIHLRYLGLRNTRLGRKNSYMYSMSTSLPASIGNLKSLYTLDLRDNYWLRLADVLFKLDYLRHLLIDRDDVGHLRLDTLRNLETLTWIEAKNVIRRDAVSKLTNLRNLGIYFETREEAEVVLQSPIFGLGHLRSLNMRMRWKNFPNLEPLSHCHHLTKLQLDGRIDDNVHSSFHNLQFLPASLTKLSLCHSHLKQDPMATLEKLPNLRFLSLDGDSYEGSVMVSSAYGFPQLEVLKLRCLDNLEEWIIEEGAMLNLKTLDIDSLRQLIKVPEGLKFASALQEMNIRWMPEAFEKRIRVINKEGGEDFDKVKHIPSLMFYP
ncbi:hypothetical protein JCGZ_01370 [Jatropha curcas]|uniref:Uncharacterized protein n=2 Tax=Jatropha curcas TaxID=180498 RepID=A0A067LJM8_JATCU|nr:hypothetical protein JCGZ_01370 [Jatropha curcas]